MTWDSAVEFCQAARPGAFLAEIRTAEEQEYITAQLASKFAKAPTLDIIHVVWLGGYRKEKGCGRSDWWWADSGDKIELTFWGGGEPSNINCGEHCLMLKNYTTRRDGSFFKWNDYSCNHKLWPLCQCCR